MVVLNPEIQQKLSHLSTEEQDLAKVILFVVDNGLSIRDALTNPESADNLAKTIELLGLFKIDYNSDPPSYSVGVPLYIETDKPIKVNKLTPQNIKRFLESNIDKYRAIFSVDERGTKGLKSGSMGDKWDCIKKLEKWFKRTKFNYTWEDVLNTARVYVSKQRDEGYKYLQAADYFIYKDGRSRLGSLIDDYKQQSVTRAGFNEFKQLI